MKTTHIFNTSNSDEIKLDKLKRLLLTETVEVGTYTNNKYIKNKTNSSTSSPSVCQVSTAEQFISCTGSLSLK